MYKFNILRTPFIESSLFWKRKGTRNCLAAVPTTVICTLTHISTALVVLMQ